MEKYIDKIQVLIDNEFITLNEVLLYAYNYNALQELNEEIERNTFEPDYTDNYEYQQMLQEQAIEYEKEQEELEANNPHNYDPSDDYLDDYTHEDIIEAQKNKAV